MKKDNCEGLFVLIINYIAELGLVASLIPEEYS